MTDSNPYPSAPHRSNDWDPAGKSEQEEQDATEKFKKKDDSGTGPDRVEPSDPVPDRPGDPKPSEIMGSGKDVSPSGVEREQESDSQSNF